MIPITLISHIVLPRFQGASKKASPKPASCINASITCLTLWRPISLFARRRPFPGLPSNHRSGRLANPMLLHFRLPPILLQLPRPSIRTAPMAHRISRSSYPPPWPLQAHHSSAVIVLARLIPSIGPNCKQIASCRRASAGAVRAMALPTVRRKSRRNSPKRKLHSRPSCRKSLGRIMYSMR